jgi:putative endonuclease
MREQGNKFEQLAKSYLKSQGLVAICDNFSCKVGEIDLIMADNKTLIFVEVKQRANNNFGGALAAVSLAKQRRIMKTAMIYCAKQKINFEQQASRFDVVAITGSNEPFDIEWIKHAFPQ